jgi:hypothetical protein
VAFFSFGTLSALGLAQQSEFIVECHSLVFRRLPGKALFSSNAERLDFLNRANRLAQRWKLSLWAFRLFQGSAHFVLEGAEKQVRQFQRLLQSGHGVWRFHRADVLVWAPVEQWRLGGAQEGLREVDRLHTVGITDGLQAPWSSLRDYLGLREAQWFDPPQELEPYRTRAQWRESNRLPVLASLSDYRRNPSKPIPAAWVDEAIVQTTGFGIACRKNAVLRSSCLWFAGWELWEITIQLSIGASGVRKAIRNCDPTLLMGVLTHLQAPQLFASIQTVDGPQSPC